MGLFGKQNTEEIEKVKLTSKLQEGKLKKEISTKDAQVSRLESKIEILKSDVEGLKEERDYFKGLEVDREVVERGKKKLALDKQDLEDELEQLTRREKRILKRSERLEAEENDEYKKGYSDGLADGLRKAHDITREDRKYMTMIAMSTNQSEAIKTSVKALEGGFSDDSNSKSK